MGKVWAQLAYRAKALIAVAGLAAVGAAEYVVSSPDTAGALQQLLPAPYSQLVPVLLAALSAALVHGVPNRPLPSSAAAPALIVASDAPDSATEGPAPDIAAAAVPAPPLAPAEPSTVTSLVQLVRAPGE